MTFLAGTLLGIGLGILGGLAAIFAAFRTVRLNW